MLIIVRTSAAISVVPKPVVASGGQRDDDAERNRVDDQQKEPERQQRQRQRQQNHDGANDGVDQTQDERGDKNRPEARLGKADARNDLGGEPERNGVKKPAEEQIHSVSLAGR